MVWDHLSITKPHLVYIILGGFTSLFMLCSSVIKEKMYIGEATVATLCGVIFGPHAANLIDPMSWGSTDIVTIEFSRIVLVVQCFAVGVELPKFYMEKHWRSVVFLLLPVMTFGWLITGLFIYWLIEPLNWLQSLVVAACVTATDPVLASSVVGKGKFAKRVPKHLRDLLSAESGCNDGMAFPFVYLALYLIHDKLSAKQVTYHWIVYTILYECVFGAVYGFLIGYFARHGIKYAERRELIDRESFLVFYFVLALFCAGSGSILGVDDLLVGFACGVGFSNDGWFTQKTEESHVSNVIDLLINLAYFVYFGTIIPWEMFNQHEIGLSAWRLSVLAIMVLLFRRIPIMMALKPVIPDIKTWREALFAGHFGPIGVGAIFIAILARAELEHHSPVPLPEVPTGVEAQHMEEYDLIVLIWPIVCFLVVASILVHGSSIAVFTLGKRINTLTITMSYTAANEDGPSWMNRLPRISSQSRSQAKTMSDTEGEELKMPEFPPGTLPPVGLPGNFLRRVKEDEKSSSKQGSRASSLSRRRKSKKWDDGLGPGGPITQSAIFPQRRTQSDLMPADSSRAETFNSQPERMLPPSDARRTSPPRDEQAQRRQSDDGPREQRRNSLQIFEEGDHIVIENQDGEVLAVEENVNESSGQRLKEKLTSEEGPSGWSYDAIKKRVSAWREEEAEKRRDRSTSGKKGEPARAWQYGTTVIVENEDGDVVKTYDLGPQGKPESTLVSHGLKYMGMGGLVKVGDKSSASGSSPVKEEDKAASKAPGRPGIPAWASGRFARPGGESARKKSVVEEQEEDDRHIRFTINDVGQRMTKEDFIREMQKLDKPTRREIIDKSNASSAVKSLARQDAPPKKHQGGPSAPSPVRGEDAARPVPARPKPTEPAESSGEPSRSTSRSASEGSDDPDGDVPETEAERRRRVAALKGVLGSAQEDSGETPAERRRREAALGMSSTAADEDSEDDDTPRVPPQKRGIRFADAPERGRK
ncbi:Na(+)/H(+) antiporter [Rhypophila sp. PSN 637]